MGWWEVKTAVSGSSGLDVAWDIKDLAPPSSVVFQHLCEGISRDAPTLTNSGE